MLNYKRCGHANQLQNYKIIDAASGQMKWKNEYDNGSGGEEYGQSLAISPDGSTVYLSGESLEEIRRLATEEALRAQRNHRVKNKYFGLLCVSWV